MHDQREKDTINILMNIDNFFGEHRGRLAPVLFFLGASGLPILVIALLFWGKIPFWLLIVGGALWTGRMALYFLCHENEKLELFMQSLKDGYATVEDMVRITNRSSDGLIEYENGTVAYILSAYCMTYAEDDELSIDMESFLNKLKDYEFDITCQLVVNEFRLQDRLDRMSVYKQEDIVKERMNFYILQDEFCDANSELYRINFIVKTYKSNAKALRLKLDEIVKSSSSSVFKTIYICDKYQANDVLSRDVCTNVDLDKMLLQKYHSEEYYGSKVLYYGDDVPEKLKPEKEVSGISNRRVHFKEGE